MENARTNEIFLWSLIIQAWFRGPLSDSSVLYVSNFPGLYTAEILILYKFRMQCLKSVLIFFSSFLKFFLKATLGGFFIASWFNSVSGIMSILGLPYKS